MLVFKGDDPKKRKKKSKHSKKEKRERDDGASAVARMPQQSSSSSRKAPPNPSIPTPVSGTGEITTSGTVVSGLGTKFEKELSAGDALIAVVGGQPQMRVVTMRLSNVSLNLSSAFSENLKHPTGFQVIRKPRDEAKQKARAHQKQILDKKQEEEKASGTFGSTEEFVYRERTEHGNYRIRREKMDGVSKSDLLYMRSKKTSDKYC